MRGRLALVAGFAAAASVAAVSAQPAPSLQGGRYAAQLCVATRADATPTCGAAEVQVAGQRLSVRVADIVYRLALRSAELDVQTMHGAMQIDEFSAAYAWDGDTLRFSDAAKNVLYEVRLGARRTAAQRQ
jgi:hypothetical protein